MGRALSELKKRLHRIWLDENRPDLDNIRDVREESLEQDRIQEKYAADNAYEESRELGCPICSHALITVSASAECPMCEVMWKYHQDDGFSYFEAEMEGIDEYYEVHSPDEIYGEYYSLDEAAEAAERLESKGITIVGIYRFGEEFVEEKEYRAEERMCYECPACDSERSYTIKSDGWGAYCRCMDCGNNFITQPPKMVMASESDNFDAEFCSECGCSHKDAEEFAAETSGGNQVFNSCWKCGSGQHLYQIARYPATASEISGVGGNPEEESEGGKRRAGTN